MKKQFTFAALAALALGSLNAQAQFSVNGVLALSEVGSGVGKYQLAGTYVGTHSVPDRGLKSLYVGTTATTLNIMVVGSPEKTDYNAFVLYLDMPNRTGTAANTRLAGGSDATSQLRHRPTLDMPVDFGFRVTLSPLTNVGTNNVYLSKIDYTAAPNATGKYPDTYLGPTNKTGIPLVVTDPTTNIVGARFAYTTVASVAANSTAGWEFEVPLAALGGAVSGDLIHVMAGYVADNGDFYSDVLPQITGQTTDLGTDPNFAFIPRLQNYTYQVGTGVLASRVAAETLNATTYPNPLTAASQLAYTVADRSQPVSVEVYDAIGQRVLTLVNEQQGSGIQQVPLGSLKRLAAGNYLVKLQVGSQLTSRRVVVE